MKKSTNNMLTFRLNILKCGDRGTNSFMCAENVSEREHKKQAAFLALNGTTGGRKSEGHFLLIIIFLFWVLNHSNSKNKYTFKNNLKFFLTWYMLLLSYISKKMDTMHLYMGIFTPYKLAWVSLPAVDTLIHSPLTKSKYLKFINQYKNETCFIQQSWQICLLNGLQCSNTGFLVSSGFHSDM